MAELISKRQTIGLTAPPVADRADRQGTGDVRYWHSADNAAAPVFVRDPKRHCARLASSYGPTKHLYGASGNQRGRFFNLPRRQRVAPLIGRSSSKMARHVLRRKRDVGCLWKRRET